MCISSMSTYAKQFCSISASRQSRDASTNLFRANETSSEYFVQAFYNSFYKNVVIWNVALIVHGYNEQNRIHVAVVLKTLYWFGIFMENNYILPRKDTT